MPVHCIYAKNIVFFKTYTYCVLPDDTGKRATKLLFMKKEMVLWLLMMPYKFVY